MISIEFKVIWYSTLLFLFTIASRYIVLDNFAVEEIGLISLVMIALTLTDVLCNWGISAWFQIELPKIDSKELQNKLIGTGLRFRLKLFVILLPALFFLLIYFFDFEILISCLVIIFTLLSIVNKVPLDMAAGPIGRLDILWKSKIIEAVLLTALLTLAIFSSEPAFLDLILIYLGVALAITFYAFCMIKPDFKHKQSFTLPMKDRANFTWYTVGDLLLTNVVIMFYLKAVTSDYLVGAFAIVWSLAGVISLGTNLVGKLEAQLSRRYQQNSETSQTKNIINFIGFVNSLLAVIAAATIFFGSALISELAFSGRYENEILMASLLFIAMSANNSSAILSGEVYKHSKLTFFSIITSLSLVFLIISLGVVYFTKTSLFTIVYLLIAVYLFRSVIIALLFKLYFFRSHLFGCFIRSWGCMVFTLFLLTFIKLNENSFTFLNEFIIAFCSVVFVFLLNYIPIRRNIIDGFNALLRSSYQHSD